MVLILLIGTQCADAQNYVQNQTQVPKGHKGKNKHHQGLDAATQARIQQIRQQENAEIAHLKDLMSVETGRAKSNVSQDLASLPKYGRGRRHRRHKHVDPQAKGAIQADEQDKVQRSKQAFQREKQKIQDEANRQINGLLQSTKR